MVLDRLSETDLFGIFYLTADGFWYEGYYQSLFALYPLLVSKEWTEKTTGYYINVAGNFNAVRLSYFTATPDQAKRLVDHFASEHKLKNIQEPVIPHPIKISEKYGGEELRFRRFLSTYAPIGLDIMKADLLNARCLLATFRWQVMRARKPYRPHFLRTFQSQSRFFNSLSVYEIDQFWFDLSHWPNPPQVDWAHMFVNMVLGCDWIQIRPDMFLNSEPALSISEINKLVYRQGFKIPLNWCP